MQEKFEMVMAFAFGILAFVSVVQLLFILYMWIFW